MCLTLAQLLDGGMTRHSVSDAVRLGALIRVRRDRYLPQGAPRGIVEAVRVGGLATCLSFLQLLGVFVYGNDVTHVHLARGASRLRSHTDPRKQLPPRRKRSGIRTHWIPLLRPEAATSTHVAVLDAVAHAVLCQPARYAIATIDSALNKGLIRVEELGAVFAALPRRFHVLEGLTDGRAQSGTETLVRLMARGLGCHIDLQVHFDGVGYVDLLIDGWLVIECDSKEFHESWQQQVKDRQRDLTLATRGYVTLRLTAAQVLYHPEQVVTAIRALRAAHPRCRR